MQKLNLYRDEVAHRRMLKGLLFFALNQFLFYSYDKDYLNFVEKQLESEILKI